MSSAAGPSAVEQPTARADHAPAFDEGDAVFLGRFAEGATSTTCWVDLDADAVLVDYEGGPTPVVALEEWLDWPSHPETELADRRQRLLAREELAGRPTCDADGCNQRVTGLECHQSSSTAAVATDTALCRGHLRKHLDGHPGTVRPWELPVTLR